MSKMIMMIRFPGMAARTSMQILFQATGLKRVITRVLMGTKVCSLSVAGWKAFRVLLHVRPHEVISTTIQTCAASRRVVRNVAGIFQYVRDDSYTHNARHVVALQDGDFTWWVLGS